MTPLKKPSVVSKHWFDVCNMATLICVITLKYIYYIVTTVRCPYYVLPLYLNACASVHSNCCCRRFSRTHSILIFDYASSLTIPHLAKFVKINLFPCHFNVKKSANIKNKSPYSGNRVFRCKCIIKHGLTFSIGANVITLESNNEKHDQYVVYYKMDIFHVVDYE